MLYDRTAADRIEPMNDRQYYVRGVRLFWMLLAEQFIILQMFISMPRKNAYDKVKKVVEREQEKHGWEFLFLGANMDSIAVAGRFGIGADRAINYECDSAGTALNYQVLSETVSAVRRSKSREETEVMVQALCAPIREDYEKRHNNRKSN